MQIYTPILVAQIEWNEGVVQFSCKIVAPISKQ